MSSLPRDMYKNLIHHYGLRQYGTKFAICPKCGWENKTKVHEHLVEHDILYHAICKELPNGNNS